MKNYVQVRFQTTATPIQNVNHDFRESKINYLREDRCHNSIANNYFIFNPSKTKRIIRKCIDEHKRLYKKKNKRNLQKGRQSTILTGIITLSPSINQLLEDQKISSKSLQSAFVRTTKALAKKIEEIVGQKDYKAKIIYAVIHYDESTPHMHFAIQNYTPSANAVWHLVRRSKRMSELQDVAAENFKKLGFTRGVRGSKSTHKSVRKMHEEEIKQLKLEEERIKKNIEYIKLLHEICKKIEVTEYSRRAIMKRLNDLMENQKEKTQGVVYIKNEITKSNKIENDNVPFFSKKYQ